MFNRKLFTAAFVGALNKAVALNGFDGKLNGDFNLNALGYDDIEIAATGLVLTLDIRLAAAFGFDPAELCIGANL